MNKLAYDLLSMIQEPITVGGALGAGQAGSPQPVAPEGPSTSDFRAGQQAGEYMKPLWQIAAQARDTFALVRVVKVWATPPIGVDLGAKHWKYLFNRRGSRPHKCDV